MLNKRYYLGIDGGGSRSEGAVVDIEQGVLHGVSGGPLNPHAAGKDQALENFSNLLHDLLSEAGISIVDLAGGCLGISGCGRPSQRQLFECTLKKERLGDRVTVTTDAAIALAGGSVSNVGILAVAGTGSIFFARNRHGRTGRIGGYGPLLSDEGSGYAIGRAALRAIARDQDGLEDAEELMQAVLEYLELADFEQLVEWSCSSQANKEEVAWLAHLVQCKAEDCDQAALRILDRAAKAIAKRVAALARKLAFGEEGFEVVLSGGALESDMLYFSLVQTAIHFRLPSAEIKTPRLSPCAGAILLAMEQQNAVPSVRIEEVLKKLSR